LRSLGLSGEIGRVEIDATVGGAFLFSDMREGVEAKHWGTYLELERPEKIVFTWWTPESENDSISRVALVLEPQGEGCVATITHHMDVRWAEDVDKAESGWSCMLAACGELLGSD
ncbi:MAG: SRPBCC domain-containing protein, partial [Acidobacteriota bacterium]|nr:SRPBCC domain-containing protein [Acidobacteriota bacterium]